MLYFYHKTSLLKNHVLVSEVVVLIIMKVDNLIVVSYISSPYHFKVGYVLHGVYL